MIVPVIVTCYAYGRYNLLTFLRKGIHLKEQMKYILELEIDGQQYSFSGPAYAPAHALYDAAAQFFLVMKEKMDKINKELEEKAKKATPEVKTPEDVKEKK